MVGRACLVRAIRAGVEDTARVSKEVIVRMDRYGDGPFGNRTEESRLVGYRDADQSRDLGDLAGACLHE